jgi:hypothetical protein
MKMQDVNAHRMLVFLAMLLLTGCNSLKLPASQGEKNSGYSYIPVDPLPVFTDRGLSCKDGEKFKGILESLPDQAVRLAIGQFDASGSLTFGPVSIGGEGKSYQIILDYISVDASQVPVFVKKESSKDSTVSVSVYDKTVIDKKTSNNYRYTIRPAARYSIAKPSSSETNDKLRSRAYELKSDLVVFPVYVGVGLRLTASVTVVKGNVNLSSLGAIAAEAKAGRLVGTLVVQTLGISGRNVSTMLPLPSEINETTVQNAILALGSIKAVLNDSSTVITPRVVGIYNPIGGGAEVVNGVISVLAEQPLTWYRPCADSAK